MNIANKIREGIFDEEIVEVFVQNNLDINSYICGAFQGNKSAYACLASYINENWKNLDISRALHDIINNNIRQIRDQIITSQQ